METQFNFFLHYAWKLVFDWRGTMEGNDYVHTNISSNRILKSCWSKFLVPEKELLVVRRRCYLERPWFHLTRHAVGPYTVIYSTSPEIQTVILKWIKLLTLTLETLADFWRAGANVGQKTGWLAQAPTQYSCLSACLPKTGVLET